MKLQRKETLDYVKNHLREDSSKAAHDIVQQNTGGMDSVKEYYERLRFEKKVL